MRTSLVLLLASCATVAPAGDGVLSNSAPDAPLEAAGLFVIRPESLGPITPTTTASAAGIQQVLGARYVVKTADNDQVDVYLGDELLFYVIANDDGTLFNVHCPSSKIAIADHPEWIIGSPLTSDAALDKCECWGPHPMCFKSGEHVAIGFDVPCGTESDFDARDSRKALVGVPIQRAVWNPRPFGEANGASSAAPPAKSILTPP